MDTPAFRDGTPVPTAREVRETGEIIFLMMKDQGTNESFGTFYAWLTDHYRHLPVATVRNVWLHCFRTHGAMNADQLNLFWRRYVEIRRAGGQRKGQALMNALPDELSCVVSTTGADCFHNDFLIGAFVDFLGIPWSEARVRASESGAA